MCGGVIVLGQLFSLDVCLFPDRAVRQYMQAGRGRYGGMHLPYIQSQYSTVRILHAVCVLLTLHRSACRLFALPVDAATGYAAHAPLVWSVGGFLVSLLCVCEAIAGPPCPSTTSSNKLPPVQVLEYLGSARLDPVGRLDATCTRQGLPIHFSSDCQ